MVHSANAEGGIVDFFFPLCDGSQKSILLFLRYWVGRGEILLEVVHLFAVFPKPEANVRSRGQAGLANIPNDLALTYGFTDGNGAFGHVQVLGFIGGVVPDFDVFAVALGVAYLITTPSPTDRIGVPVGAA